MKSVSIITVNFNQPKATCELLLSIKKHYGNNVEVILVDNASDENFESEFKNIISDLVFIRSKVNLGFAGGNNFGISFAKGDYLLLLNNDTEIPKGFIETLVEELKSDDKIGLLSPLILYDDDRSIIQYAGYTPLNYITARNSQIGQSEKNKGQYNGVTKETGFCHGAAVICRKEYLNEAGLMDENYFLYYEELDWCEKFKKVGKTINFTGKTHIFHKESITVGKESAVKTYFITRNRMLFIRKNTSTFNTFLFTIYYVLIACPKAIISLRNKGRKDLVKWVIKGLMWNFTHQKNSKDLGFKIN
ncbi:glycosyl transferase [Pedobacter psychrophilus]|uniref:Glycosyl transferase n=1 Tax=Pedobacter psychrophilus TaxID=1826909 RepID=A0A179DK98_9SPHI|nr:glycosyltransferase family 2 protein [Pedobacter psychrophilus]OAQ40813.1 glycosyl transferase [Pedobacter psychrophilus]